MMAGRIAVVGAGTMGCGIAQAALGTGYEVTLIVHSEKGVKEARERIATVFEKAIAKGAMTNEKKEECMKRLKISWDIKDVNGAEIIIEAVPEEPNTKKDVLSSIGRSAGQNAIIATNTSSISIAALSPSVGNPGRFLGMHFFNPVPVMKLVELVRGKETSDAAMDIAKAFASGMGKVAVEVKDSPGFVSNRILMVFINEAITALEEGISGREAIDTIAKLGFNHPMGPLELADYIGLDVCRDIMESIYEQTGDAKFKPAKLLVDMVGMGNLGRKSGKGFYEYKPR